MRSVWQFATLVMSLALGVATADAQVSFGPNPGATIRPPVPPVQFGTGYRPPAPPSPPAPNHRHRNHSAAAAGQRLPYPWANPAPAAYPFVPLPSLPPRR